MFKTSIATLFLHPFFAHEVGLFTQVKFLKANLPLLHHLVFKGWFSFLLFCPHPPPFPQLVGGGARANLVDFAHVLAFVNLEYREHVRRHTSSRRCHTRACSESKYWEQTIVHLCGSSIPTNVCQACFLQAQGPPLSRGISQHCAHRGIVDSR